MEKKTDYLKYLKDKNFVQFARYSDLEVFFHDNPFCPIHVIVRPEDRSLRVKMREEREQSAGHVEISVKPFEVELLGKHTEMFWSQSHKAKYVAEVTRQWRIYMYGMLDRKRKALSERYLQDFVIYTKKYRDKFGSPEEYELFVKKSIYQMKNYHSEANLEWK